MKAIRKLLAMALVIVMVLSMSIFVFATEEELQPRSCAHNIVHRQVVRYEWGSPTVCYKYYDLYEQCEKCGYVFSKNTSGPHEDDHFVEEGDSYCWQCHRYGCS